MPTPTSEALILTEDTELERSLSETLATCGFQAYATSRIDNALERIESRPPELILTDLDVAGGDPMEFLGRAKRSTAPGRMLVLVSESSIPRAAGAIGMGVPWFLKKPLGAAEVRLALGCLQAGSSNGASGRGGEDASRKDAEDAEEDLAFGSSPEIQSVLKVAGQAAAHGTHLSIIGEAGVGKHQIGRRIHRMSPRAANRFMSFSCAGLSENVIDSALFGREDAHVGGSGVREPGCLELCDKGTLLVDGIEDLPPRTQDKLLRCIMRRSFQLPGSQGARPADVRILAASNADLEECARDGRFHRELFDRLAGVRIRVPALRERKSDIPMLADRFVRAGARRAGRSLKGVAPEALARLMQYDWPGNVQELKDFLQHAVGSSSGAWLGPDDLPSLPVPEASASGIRVPGSTIQDIEREAILRTLDQVDGSTSRAAKILNMSVRKIQYKLKEYRREASASAPLETVRTAPAKPAANKSAVMAAVES